MVMNLFKNETLVAPLVLNVLPTSILSLLARILAVAISCASSRLDPRIYVILAETLDSSNLLIHC